MPKKGQWWSQDPRTSEWGMYAPDDNAKIEASYQGARAPVQLDFCGNVFTVDIKKMEQRNSTGGSRRIKREEVEMKSAGPAGSHASSATPAGVDYVKNTFTGGVDTVTVAQFGDFFEALGIDGATAEPFVFFYHMQPQGCWQITAEELSGGLQAAGVNATSASKTEVKKLVAKWIQEDSASVSSFTDMYTWCFEFCRNSPSASTIPGEEATGYLSALLPLLPAKKSKHEPLVDFLGSKAPSVARDLWKQLPKFLVDVKSDYSNYDDFFFHTKLDDFVEQMTK